MQQSVVEGSIEIGIPHAVLSKPVQLLVFAYYKIVVR